MIVYCANCAKEFDTNKQDSWHDPDDNFYCSELCFIDSAGSHTFDRETRIAIQQGLDSVSELPGSGK